MKIAIDLVPPAVAAPRRRGLRQWQKFLLTVLTMDVIGAWVLAQITGGLFVPALAMLTWLLAQAIILFVVWRLGRWR